MSHTSQADRELDSLIAEITIDCYDEAATSRFAVPGRYELFCYLHPITMHEVVDVRPANALAPPAVSASSKPPHVRSAEMLPGRRWRACAQGHRAPHSAYSTTLGRYVLRALAV